MCAMCINIALSMLQDPRPSYPPHRNIVCWNCRQMGHVCVQCQKPRTQPYTPKQGAATPVSGTANAAEPEDDDTDGVWAVLKAEEHASSQHNEILGFYQAPSLAGGPEADVHDDDMLGLF